MPGFVKNSEQKIEQFLNKERAAKLTTNTTEVNQAHFNPDETACTFLQIPTAFIMTSNFLTGYSQIRKENHPRSASLIRTEPIVNIKKIVIKCELNMFISLYKHF